MLIEFCEFRDFRGQVSLVSLARTMDPWEHNAWQSYQKTMVSWAKCQGTKGELRPQSGDIALSLSLSGRKSCQNQNDLSRKTAYLSKPQILPVPKTWGTKWNTGGAIGAQRCQSTGREHCLWCPSIFPIVYIWHVWRWVSLWVVGDRQWIIRKRERKRRERERKRKREKERESCSWAWYKEKARLAICFEIRCEQVSCSHPSWEHLLSALVIPSPFFWTCLFALLATSKSEGMLDSL